MKNDTHEGFFTSGINLEGGPVSGQRKLFCTYFILMNSARSHRGKVAILKFELIETPSLI